MMTFDEKLERQQRRSERNRNQTKRRYESSHEERTTEPETRTGVVVNCELLNFRSTSERKSKTNILRTLKKGDTVRILDEVESKDSPGVKMLLVIHNYREGYIASEFCQEV